MVEMREDQLRLMEEKLCISPRQLATWAGNHACCIFRVPSSFPRINRWTYEPQFVSIGPFHRGGSSLSMLEEHKWFYLRSILDRTEMKLQDLMKVIDPLEKEAKECYSEDVQMNREEFMEMMLLDGCFILELFRREAVSGSFDKQDPIFILPWVLPSLAQDLLKLENQIPYCILHRLFESIEGTFPVNILPLLALRFFSRVSGKPKNVNNRFAGEEFKHLLDLIRQSYIEGFPKSSGQDESSMASRSSGMVKKFLEPFRKFIIQRRRLLPNDREKADIEFSPQFTHSSHVPKTPRRSQEDYLSVISTMSKLSQSGIRAKQAGEESFLRVTFENGKLCMPTITFSDSMGPFLHNCISFEQCHGRKKLDFTTYAVLLDCLIDTTQDVEYLCEAKIIENLLGSNEELVSLINGLGKEVSYDLESSNRYDAFMEIDKYYKNSWHRHWASFKSSYMRTPWIFLSTVAAIILLLLTFIQTLYTLFGYYHP